MIHASPITLDGPSGMARPFPVVMQCESSAGGAAEVADWVQKHRETLIAQLAEHGAILFRGFPLTTADDFDAFVVAFDLPNFPYEESLSNAVRLNRTPRVFTANEAPPSVQIHLHHEMAQTPVFPGQLFFFCEQPAESGGATPLCPSDELWQRLAQACPDFAADCQARGLQYTNVMPGNDDPNSGMGRSWQSTLGVSTREEAEQSLQKLGYSWEWLDDDCLRATTPVLPAVRDLGGGRFSFFNQLIAAHEGWKDVRNDPSRSITFGDGTPLDPGGVAEAVRISEEVTFDVAWQAGDVALVDNFAVMHGRRTFTGTRRVLASLASAQTVRS